MQLRLKMEDPFDFPSRLIPARLTDLPTLQCVILHFEHIRISSLWANSAGFNYGHAWKP